MKTYLLFIMLLVLPLATGEVLFSDNFDGHADWSPDQTIASACYGDCLSNPDGYYGCRLQGTIFFDGPGHNSLDISGENRR